MLERVFPQLVDMFVALCPTLLISCIQYRLELISEKLILHRVMSKEEYQYNIMAAHIGTLEQNFIRP